MKTDHSVTAEVLRAMRVDDLRALVNDPEVVVADLPLLVEAAYALAVYDRRYGTDEDAEASERLFRHFLSRRGENTQEQCATRCMRLLGIPIPGLLHSGTAEAELGPKPVSSGRGHGGSAA
ncbi:MAG: hypothetical protein HY457_00800 [Parcubacteria group bacterium]|nr:hypothetical protein [Parcubacteria group bacterium]